VCDSCPTELARDLDGAFARFVDHHQSLVYGIAARALGAPDAEDVAQEAFLRAWRALRGYPRERIVQLRTRGWMARVTLNVARNRARDAGPRTDPLDPARCPSHDQPDPGTMDPESHAQRRESAERWAALLATLPTRYRRAVELRHVEGLSYQELAEALDRPVGTVKSDVHRGVRLLRAAYARSMTARDEGPAPSLAVSR
jgi:RNA polymerase sigma-70 factor (ECF subfamily)